MALTKEEAVSDFTDKRTTSLSSLSAGELAGIEQYLSTLTSHRQASAPVVDPIGDNLRKGIISQFLSIGRDVKAAKDWAEKYGVQGNKRKFNDYNHQELYLLFQNAKKMKKDHIKSVTRRP